MEMNKRPTPLAGPGLVVTLAVVLAASGGWGGSTTTPPPVDQSSATAMSTSTTTVVTTTATADADIATATKTDEMGAFSSGAFATSDFPANGKTIFLTSVDLSSQTGFDRLTFGLDGDVSTLSYQIVPLSPPILELPSGLPIDVAGDTFFKVTLSPASVYEFANGETVARYEGPDRVAAPADAAVVIEVVKTEDFQGVLSWVVGLAGEASYARDLQANQGRLVIDFRSG